MNQYQSLDKYRKQVPISPRNYISHSLKIRKEKEAKVQLRKILLFSFLFISLLLTFAGDNRKSQQFRAQTIQNISEEKINIQDSQPQVQSADNIQETTDKATQDRAEASQIILQDSDEARPKQLIKEIEKYEIEQSNIQQTIDQATDDYAESVEQILQVFEDPWLKEAIKESEGSGEIQDTVQLESVQNQNQGQKNNEETL